MMSDHDEAIAYNRGVDFARAALAGATSAELREMVRAAEAREALERKAKMDRVTPVYRYMLTPVPANKMLGDRVTDPACRLYQLTGKVMNKEDLTSVGKTANEGGMRYLYNTLSGRFAMQVGGGTIFLNNEEGWDELSQWIGLHPDGGDVTDLVNLHRVNNKTWH